MIASVSIFVKFFLTISADTRRDFYSDVYNILNGITLTLGNFDINACILASLAALMTSSIWTALELSPYAIFSAILVSNNTGSWDTMPIWDRSHWSFSCRMSVPSATLMNGWNIKVHVSVTFTAYNCIHLSSTLKQLLFGGNDSVTFFLFLSIFSRIFLYFYIVRSIFSHTKLKNYYNNVNYRNINIYNYI